MERNRLKIELFVKSIIVLLCTGFIILKYSDYVVDNYGGTAYIGFVLLVNGITYASFTAYYKRRIRRFTRIRMFKAYCDKCTSFYEEGKKTLKLDRDKFFTDPEEFIQALGVHEFMIGEYTDKKTLETFLALKKELLVAIVAQDINAIDECADRLIALFSTTKFKHNLTNN